MGAVTGALITGTWEGALYGAIGGAATGLLFGAIGGGLTALAILTKMVLPLVAFSTGMTSWGAMEGLIMIERPEAEWQVVGALTMILSVIGGTQGIRAGWYLHKGQPVQPGFNRPRVCF